MRLDGRGQPGTLLALCVISGWILIATSGSAIRTQETPVSSLVVYLDDGPYVVTPLERNGRSYLLLSALLQRLALPYTDATATGLFTIQGSGRVITLERQTGRVTLDGVELRMNSPAINEGGEWLVPVDFLVDGIGGLLNVPFSVTGSRVVAGNVEATSLAMEAVQADGVTRLTLRLDASSNVRVQQDADLNIVTLNIDRAPVIPEITTLDYRDSSIRSVSFDDSDGSSRVIVETTPQVVNLRLVPADGNRTFLLELVSAEAPLPSVAAVPAPGPLRPDAPGPGTAQLGPIRTLAIDPGHGGLDSGTGARGTLEKDLTLLLARRLQATLEERLDTTVILTREQDIGLPLEARSAIANENRVDLLISLHVGFSPDETESRTTVFVMHDANTVETSSEESLFVPWYGAQRQSHAASEAFAADLVSNLSARVPEWASALSEAPLAVLASATMPAVVAELGNANNPEDLARLTDPEFQNRLIEAIVDSVQSAGSSEPEETN